MLNWYKILACKLLKNNPFPQKNGGKKNLITNLSENFGSSDKTSSFFVHDFSKFKVYHTSFFFFFFFSFQNL